MFSPHYAVHASSLDLWRTLQNLPLTLREMFLNLQTSAVVMQQTSKVIGMILSVHAGSS